MAHTNSTTNYQLPQFVGTDKPSWLTDVNNAYTAIDTAMKANADGVTSASALATQASASAQASATSAQEALEKGNEAISVASSKISNSIGSVSETNIADNAVTEDKIADGAVKTYKIGSGAVTSSKIGRVNLYRGTAQSYSTSSFQLSDSISNYTYVEIVYGGFGDQNKEVKTFVPANGSVDALINTIYGYGSNNGAQIKTCLAQISGSTMHFETARNDRVNLGTNSVAFAPASQANGFITIYEINGIK